MTDPKPPVTHEGARYLANVCRDAGLREQAAKLHIYIDRQEAAEREHANQLCAGVGQLEMAALDYVSLDNSMNIVVKERDALRAKLQEAEKRVVEAERECERIRRFPMHCPACNTDWK